MDLPSPRVGEVPPALSPLDAFAMHSRMLAKKFEEKNGRRVSRLPHTEIARELAKRPDFFRAFSSGSESSTRDIEDEDDEEDQQQPGSHMLKVTSDKDRPVSQYPRFSNIIEEPDTSSTPADDQWFDCADGSASKDQGYFGISVPRASSPEPLDRRSGRPAISPNVPSLTSSVDSVQSSQSRTLTNESTSSRRNEYGLAPPRSPMHPRSPRSIASIRSVPVEDDDSGARVSYEHMSTRKSSNSSYISASRPPLTPDMQPICRSPSLMSEYSQASGHMQKPSLNFSRPLSSSGQTPRSNMRPSFDERPSLDSRPSFDSPYAQSTMTGSPSRPRRGRMEEAPNNDSMDPRYGANAPHVAGAPSYIYAKYSLPRGRTIERGEIGSRDSWGEHQFAWEEEAPSLQKADMREPTLPFDDDVEELTSQSRQLALNQPTVTVSRSQSAERPPSARPKAAHKSAPSTPSVTSQSTDKTIRLSHLRNSPSAEISGLSPEEHLEKGIECHTSGSLSKSTYHLRLAAKAGLPTAMLLYALACRHGWGMRPNQADGVAWLKRALDSAGVDLSSDADPLATATRNSTIVLSAQQSKERKAQFALAVYELGMSYMNGWGIPRDRTLAVRCFEIAGGWGDADALAEAGYCYTEGVGCKKNLKKAAGFYRKAAEGGISMAGNSW